jgi:hypothetical protein
LPVSFCCRFSRASQPIFTPQLKFSKKFEIYLLGRIQSNNSSSPVNFCTSFGHFSPTFSLVFRNPVIRLFNDELFFYTYTKKYLLCEWARRCPKPMAEL